MSSSINGMIIVLKGLKSEGAMPIDHYAIVTGDGSVIHNNPGAGVKEEPLQNFLQSNIKLSPGEDMEEGINRYINEGKLLYQESIPEHANLVVQNARDMIGQAYNVLSFNCEHFARKAFEGTSYSTQVTFWSTLSLVAGAGLLWWLTPKRDKSGR